MVLVILGVVLVVLEVVLVVLGVVLVVLHGAQRQCSEQMFGTDSVRNNAPSQLRDAQERWEPYKDLIRALYVSPLINDGTVGSTWVGAT